MEVADSGVAPPYHRRRERKLQELSKEERHRRLTERARKGGLALLAKRGKEHFVQMGRRGGRPTWRDSLAKARASIGKASEDNHSQGD